MRWIDMARAIHTYEQRKQVTTMTPFNKYMSDYDMTLLRVLAGDLTGLAITPGAAFNVVSEDMRDWGYLDRECNVTQKGRDYIRDWVHMYKTTDI